MRKHSPAVTRALDAIAEAEAAAPIDLALARLIAGLDAEHAAARGAPPDPDRARTLALTAALVSRQTRDGHSGIDLEDHAGGLFPEDAHARSAFRARPRLPAADDWRRHLAASPAVGGPGDACPLVLDGGRLALRRHWEAERRVAQAIADRLAPLADAPSQAARDAFGRLFPTAQGGSLDLQALAAAAALRQRVLLVAGGPGTGKTYTAARLLALALADTPSVRVALAAPTGKAASGLEASIAKRLADLPDDLAAPVPTNATTLHALLGAHPERPGFRHDARRPLPHDLVVVDEGSMVDLRLFDGLLAALRPGARLVVLGDPDQLPPVGVGTTFADLVDEGGGAVPAPLAAFAGALGLAGVPATDDAAPLAASVVTLTASYRFNLASDVGVFGLAVRDGKAAAAVEALRQRGGLDLVETEPAGAALAWALPFAREVVGAASPDAALEALGRFRLLAAVRHGPRGVEGLGEALERALRDEGRIRWNPHAERFYDGRPMLVTVNDRDTGLSNGDVGVCWRLDGEPTVVFPDQGPVSLFKLPAHEPAWALTVHKSQGAEFGAVGVVLPEPGTRGATLVTRELLYTAATRAKASVRVFGSASAVAGAVAHRQRRASGLPARLAEALGAAQR